MSVHYKLFSGSDQSQPERICAISYTTVFVGSSTSVSGCNVTSNCNITRLVYIRPGSKQGGEAVYNGRHPQPGGLFSSEYLYVKSNGLVEIQKVQFNHSGQYQFKCLDTQSTHNRITHLAVIGLYDCVYCCGFSSELHQTLNKKTDVVQYYCHQSVLKNLQRRLICTYMLIAM
jgi:hypothetical protein